MVGATITRPIGLVMTNYIFYFCSVQSSARFSPCDLEEMAPTPVAIAIEHPPAPATGNEKPAVASEPHAPEGPFNLASSISDSYPEGGRAAYLSLFGCFCAWMSAYGLMNTIGTFQAYLGTHQLAAYSEADVGWIFGLYLFMAYCCGVQTGPVFDAMGPRWLTIAGSVILVMAMFLLEACSRGCYVMFCGCDTVSFCLSPLLTWHQKVITISSSYSPSLVAWEPPS